MNDIEVRFLTSEPITVTRAEGGAATVEGYAALFNSLSEDFGGFRERLLKGAFDTVLGDDVRFLINHDGVPLARTKSDTLKVWTDDKGLKFSASLPETEAARSLSIALERGDINGASFQFRTKRELWEFINDKELGVIREIKAVTALLDVSVVTYPAYPSTSVKLKRSLDELKKELDDFQKPEPEAESYEIRHRLAAAYLDL